MKVVFFFFALYLLFCVCSWIYERIKLYKMNRRFMQKLKHLEEQTANINLEHIEHELMDLQHHARELFAHIDSTTGKKNTA
ncbi:MAG: hypothetical protein ABR911_09495 [Syntrophales bacterium]